MSQSRLPDRNLSRSAAEKVKGDVGVVCGARKPLGTPARRGGSGMRNLRDGVPGDQRGDREASLAAMFEMPRFRCVFAGESEQNSVCSFASVDLTVVRT